MEKSMFTPKTNPEVLKVLVSLAKYVHDNLREVRKRTDWFKKAEKEAESMHYSKGSEHVERYHELLKEAENDYSESVRCLDVAKSVVYRVK